ncbi:MAG: glycoside hydrolase family 43 protein [Cyclobacteriaceae bacterium]|nr:glycoside hydrolase family 43 protein [Cyclobacteriaceae bacterium]
MNKFLIAFCTALLLACASKPQTESRVFQNPLLLHGPDPWVFQLGEVYYVTHSTGNSIKIYRTQSLSTLREAESKIVWTPPATGMNSKEIWAPEIHFINNKWYAYYAADDGLNENHRMWVLENESADPLQGTWVDKGKLNLADDRWAIDGSVFEHNSQLYFIWSGWEGTVNGRQDIYISKLTNPWTAEGRRVLISKPEFNWEMQGTSDELPTVNEGPQMLKRGNKLFIVYSASGCWTDAYTLGMLTAGVDADLMDPASWKKSTQPVFSQNADGHAFGAGHNSFFKSPDGTEDWIIYHANPEAGQGCGNKRSMRMQPISWSSEGSPVLGAAVSLDAMLPVPSGEN